MALFTAKMNPSELAPILDDVMQMAVLAERVKRRRELEEHFPVLRLRTTESQIIDKSLANLYGERQSECRACL